MFRGTVDGASVYPRGGRQGSAAAQCRSVHPGAQPPERVAEPSPADELITRRVRDALGLLDIRVIDHLVVAAGGSVSVAEQGLLCPQCSPAPVQAGVGLYRVRRDP